MSAPRSRPPLLPAALAAALAACAPRQEWVNPATGPETRALDSRECDAAAWRYAESRRFFYGGAYGPYGGGVAWSQSNTLAALDRSRFFAECMTLRGYKLQPVAPE
jgi:hypothetical protein